ncbi:hypothetical protein E2320_022845, partial [Naja naja]
EKASHLKWLLLSVEKGCDLIPFTLQKSLLPSRLVSRCLFCVQEPHSCSDWLALRLRGKPGLSAITAVPLCGGRARRLFSHLAVVAKEEPPPGTLMPAVIQNSASCSLSPSVAGVSSGAM